MTATTETVRDGFLRSRNAHPERPALSIGKESLSYAELDQRARRIGATLRKHAPTPVGEHRLSAVFGHRAPSAFAGILGILYEGHGYVPLNPAFPVDRSRVMLERSHCRGLVVDTTGEAKLAELLAGIQNKLVVVLPDADDVGEFSAAFPLHHFIGRPDLEDAGGYELGPVSPDDLVYLLFTSGSTGTPKGVMVAQRNVVAFVHSMVERYRFDENDRFSQTFDLTFDLSAFDMFCAWACGACLCVPTAQQKLFPGKYVTKQALTVWFSVPSTGVLMSKLRMLKPSSYPTLRWTLFCGEALPVEIAERFAAAAPDSIVENLYGPTELTIACTLYRWRGEDSHAEALHGVVPIGVPYPDMVVRVSDAEGNEVPVGTDGELLLTGPQVALGYWEDQARTDKAFVVPPGEDRIYYRTGDRVRQVADGPLIYLGRVDNQIKIMGYRVELGEIEAVLRSESGADVAIAIGWPLSASGADGIVGFVSPSNKDVAHIQQSVKAFLPAYMQPSRVIQIDTFPLNANGKTDRKALQAMLEGEAS